MKLYKTKNLFVLNIIFLSFMISCTTMPPKSCTILVKQQINNYDSQIDVLGDHIYFRLYFEGRNCIQSKFDQIADNFFKEYSKNNGYSNYKVIRKNMDKIYGYRRFVVAFEK